MSEHHDEVETWVTLIRSMADCLTCLERSDPEEAIDKQEQAKIRRWARSHAVLNPGHHVAFETAANRSYLVRIRPDMPHTTATDDGATT